MRSTLGYKSTAATILRSPSKYTETQNGRLTLSAFDLLAALRQKRDRFGCVVLVFVSFESPRAGPIQFQPVGVTAVPRIKKGGGYRYIIPPHVFIPPSTRQGQSRAAHDSFFCKRRADTTQKNTGSVFVDNSCCLDLLYLCTQARDASEQKRLGGDRCRVSQNYTKTSAYQRQKRVGSWCGMDLQLLAVVEWLPAGFTETNEARQQQQPSTDNVVFVHSGKRGRAEEKEGKARAKRVEMDRVQDNWGKVIQ